jgi:alpha-galactosidase
MQSLLDKLLFTGWQSWSIGSSENALFRFPSFDYSPVKVEESKIPDLEPRDIKLKKPAKGWCSWYEFGSNINEHKILSQVEWLARNDLKEFEYILIDDGWETNWGDWLYENKDRFPNGLKEIAAKIKQAGFKPGIWLAPFLVSPKSQLFKNHPEWLVRKNGKFVEGLRFTPLDSHMPYKRYILDINNEQAMRYVADILEYLVDECGFELLKLDFLYGIYFSPNHTDLQLDAFLKDFLTTIKESYPEVYTIACGCPLVPAIGVVDSMRIGFDTLIPYVQGVPIIKDITNEYLYRRVLESIEKRAWTKIFWNVDPDVFVCRRSLGLTDKQIYKLREEIKKTGGNLFLGDDLTKLDKEKVDNFIRPLL